ncbi:XRE family transcriptional regulator [Anaerotruncus sp. AF02-27]|jgi:transcriptional regulator with XRE-family HTH domain|nr:XRE family transcriptional regulator [Anaerotruncus sp. AF02-27]
MGGIRMTIGEIVGRKIKEYRKEHKITQLDFAMDTYMSVAYVSKFERGLVTNPTQATLVHIANCLGMTVEQLIHDDFADDTAVREAKTDADSELFMEWLRVYREVPEWKKRQTRVIMHALLYKEKEDTAP